MRVMMSLLAPENERQRSVKGFWSCILDIPRDVEQHTPIIILLDASIGKDASDDIPTTS